MSWVQIWDTVHKRSVANNSHKYDRNWGTDYTNGDILLTLISRNDSSLESQEPGKDTAHLISRLHFLRPL